MSQVTYLLTLSSEIIIAGVLKSLNLRSALPGTFTTGMHISRENVAVSYL